MEDSCGVGLPARVHLPREKLRDRDAPISKEGIIFRVLGYDHPEGGYICDPEYAPATVFRSRNARAPRTGGRVLYYKFYEDEGLKYISEKFPQYRVYFDVLGEYLVGIPTDQIVACRFPDLRLMEILESGKSDPLLDLLHKVLGEITERSKLKPEDFGVFGSILHGFYHIEYSDLDLIIYGRKETLELREVLSELFKEEGSRWLNEFEHWQLTMQSKRWRFKNWSFEEFLEHGRRKLLYCVYDARDEALGRYVKVEFEPVKKWDEIRPLYGRGARVRRIGWIVCEAEVVGDADSLFFPSVYEVDEIRVLEGPKVDEIRRVITYVEEFRFNAQKGDHVMIAGWLEEVSEAGRTYYQIVLTYAPRYYEQVLKRVRGTIR